MPPAQATMVRATLLPTGEELAFTGEQFTQGAFARPRGITGAATRMAGGAARPRGTTGPAMRVPRAEGRPPGVADLALGMEPAVAQARGMGAAVGADFFSGSKPSEEVRQRAAFEPLR